MEITVVVQIRLQREKEGCMDDTMQEKTLARFLLDEIRRERRFRYVRMFIWIVIIGILTATPFFSSPPLGGGGIFFEKKYKEIPGNLHATNAAKIVVMPLRGVILSDTAFKENSVMTEELMTGFLEKIERDQTVKAVIFDIQSPGGEMLATDNIYKLIRKKLSEKYTVSYINGMAASGGYYLALAGDEIYAHPLSLIGNIGVIMNLLNYRGLAEKLGIKAYTFKSGALKDTGNPFRDMTTEEENLLNDFIQQMHSTFVTLLTERRKEKILPTQLSSITDGRIFSAKDGLEYGLVDGVLSLDETIDFAAAKLGKDSFTKITVVKYNMHKGLLSGLFGKLQSAVLTALFENTTAPLVAYAP